MSMTTQAVVDVRALQKSLNQMSRDERVEFIRASGDPRISVRIAVRDADQPNAPAQPSPVAENLLKERIKAFGFRTWSDDDNRAAEAKQAPDFAVQGEVQVKKLSARLEASGVVVTKYTLASWTVKCIDRATGEEIYFNTTLPKGIGSWAERRRRDEGDRREDRRRILAQLLPAARRRELGRKVTLIVDGMPDAVEDALARELVGLPAVLAVAPRAKARPRVYDLQLAGSGPEGDLVAAGVLKALNAKFGQACFALGPHRRRRGQRHFRQELQRSGDPRATRDESAGRIVRRAAGPAEGADQGSRDAAPPDDLRSTNPMPRNILDRLADVPDDLRQGRADRRRDRSRSADRQRRARADAGGMIVARRARR